jgi:hypothetical protein
MRSIVVGAIALQSTKGGGDVVLPSGARRRSATSNAAPGGTIDKMQSMPFDQPLITVDAFETGTRNAIGARGAASIK